MPRGHLAHLVVALQHAPRLVELLVALVALGHQDAASAGDLEASLGAFMCLQLRHAYVTFALRRGRSITLFDTLGD